MPAQKDFYDVLDLESNALPEEIRWAYRHLVRHCHLDFSAIPGATTHFRAIQEAYEALSHPDARRKYDDQRLKAAGVNCPSAFKLWAVASHPNLQATPQEQAYYVCLNINSLADIPTTRLPLNLCLVIDRSTSMRGKRLRQVKAAIQHIVGQLRPEDALSLVLFSDRAEVLLPSQKNVRAADVKSLVESIQPNGGTEILQGLKAGLAELRQHRSQETLNHLILLTDGQTYGDEQGCLEQAEWAGSRQISFSTIGIGSDWNEDLLDQMAASSNGRSIYIDSAEKTGDIFDEILQDLETVVSRDLRLQLHLRSNVRLHEVYQIRPHIKRLNSQRDKIELGALSAGQTKMLLLEFRVSHLTPGKQRLMRLTVEGDIAGATNDHRRDWVEVSVGATEAPILSSDIPAVVKSSLSKLSIFKMQEKVRADIDTGQVATATQRLKIIATQLFDLGEASLAHVALLEAGRLPYTQTLSNKGRKAIRYGTRALSGLPQEMFTMNQATA